jgi:hypothetical protein
MSAKTWEHFFKPEVRSSGRAFVTKGKVSQARPSDTEIQTYVRTSTSFKVTFKSLMGSDTVAVDCTCPQSKKGQLCKHIWAALLVIEEKNSDFLDYKTELQNGSLSNFETVAKPTKNQAQIDSQAAFKLKQADYRKQQYQKQKQFAKDRKQAKKDSSEVLELPPAVELALQFFLDNGFPLRDSLNKDSISFANKRLARIFHPDLGGSHDEILELNKFADILTKFVKG